MACKFPFRISGSNKVLLKLIQQLKRNSNIAVYAYCTTNQKPKLCLEESDRNKAMIYSSPLGIDCSDKVSLNSSQYLQKNSEEMIIALYAYCITYQGP
jgi:hypothetical protein